MFYKPVYRPDVQKFAAQGRPTVLVPLSVKDGEEFLERAITSVLDQEGVDLRLEIYDNGSTDGSLDIARRYVEADPRVHLIQNPPGLNYFCSMNRAIHGAETEFFCPWACDDVMLPGNLAEKCAALREYPEAGFAWSPSLIVDDHDQIHDFYPSVKDLEPFSPAPTFFPFLVPVGQVVMSSVVARTDAMRAVGGFDARSVLVGDWLCWMKLSMRFGVVTVPYSLIQYRQHEGCGSFAAKRGGYAKEEPAVLRQALRDPMFRPEWQSAAGVWMVQLIAHVAHGLMMNQIYRFEQGFAAYGLAGQALPMLPGDKGMHKYWRQLLELGGLAAPELPCTVVAKPDLNPAAVTRLVKELRYLKAGQVAEHVIVITEPGEAPAAAELLRIALATGDDLDIDLAPTGTLGGILRPGMLFVTPFESPLAAEAEHLGAPAQIYDIPDCFDRPRDPDRWENIDGPREQRAAA